MTQANSKIIGDGSIIEAKLATGAVVEAKIGTGAVTQTKIGANAVGVNQLASGAVTEVKLASSAVSNAKLAADAVDSTKIADDAINSEHIVDAAIDGVHLSTDAAQTVLKSKYVYLRNQVNNKSAGSSTLVEVTDEVFGNANTLAVDADDSANQGIITDAPYNKASIRVAGTDQAIEDGSSRLVYGRLVDVATALTGTLTFTNGSATISASGGAFTTELAADDWIRLDSSRIVGQILTVDNDNQVTLKAVYAGASGSGAGSKVQVNMEFYVDTDGQGTEAAHTMGGESIDFRYAESFTLFSALASSFLLGDGFADPLPAGHNHDSLYFRETELTATSGAGLIGADDSGFSVISGSDAQALFQSIDANISASNLAPKYESLVATAQNVLPDLSETPIDDTTVQGWFGIGHQKNGSDFSVTGTSVTWNSGTAGFDIEIGESLDVYYLFDNSGGGS